MEILGQEEEARSAGAASRLRSSEDQPLEGSQAEEEARGLPSPEGRQEEESLPEIEAREYADGESRGVDPLVLSDGDKKIVPHRELQEEEDPSGKELDSKNKGLRRSRRSSPEGLGRQKERPSRRRRTGGRVTTGEESTPRQRWQRLHRERSPPGR